MKRQKCMVCRTLGTDGKSYLGRLRLCADCQRAGWLFCDGSAVNRTSFAGLFEAIGKAYGEPEVPRVD